jgi:hypothetical protein
MTIIEARGRGGQLLERFRCSKAVITIGRAFDNDFILEDEYVSPHHLRLAKLEQGWRFEDTDSLNGLRIGRRRTANGVLQSGDELRVGHTSLHIYDDDHPVDASLKLDGAEARLSALGRHRVWFLLTLVSVAITAVTLYWNTFEEFRPLTILDPLLTSVLAMFLVAAFWALLGRLLRHKAYFFAHLSLWLIYGLLGVLATFISGWIAYNANSQLLAQSLQQGLSFCVLAFATWGSMTLATNLRNKARFSSALGVAVVFLMVGLAGQLRFEREFSSAPDYYSKLMAPPLLFAKPVEDGRLLDELPALFDRADTEIQEDEKSAAEESTAEQ